MYNIYIFFCYTRKQRQRQQQRQQQRNGSPAATRRSTSSSREANNELVDAINDKTSRDQCNNLKLAENDQVSQCVCMYMIPELFIKQRDHTGIIFRVRALKKKMRRGKDDKILLLRSWSW